MEGDLPAEIGTFNRMLELDLFGNRLTTVHTDMSNLDALETLNFNNALLGSSMTMDALLNILMQITPSSGGSDSTLTGEWKARAKIHSPQCCVSGKRSDLRRAGWPRDLRGGQPAPRHHSVNVSMLPSFDPSTLCELFS